MYTCYFEIRLSENDLEFQKEILGRSERSSVLR